MLGHTLCRVLTKNHDVYGTLRGASSEVLLRLQDYLETDHIICNFEALSEQSLLSVFTSVKPQVVVNCVGIVKQIPEASDTWLNIAVNALLPHRIGQLCQSAGARLIHISTDCVFSGNTGNYRESDVPDAGDLYGRTKILGEVHGAALTLRTSMIGPQLTGHKSLFDWFVLNQEKSVKGFSKAIFSGLTTFEISNTISHIISDFPDLQGTYHVASDPIDKYSLLALIKKEYGLSIEIERDESFVIDRSLNDDRFRTATKSARMSWTSMIPEMQSTASQILTGVK